MVLYIHICHMTVPNNPSYEVNISVITSVWNSILTVNTYLTIGAYVIVSIMNANDVIYYIW